MLPNKIEPSAVRAVIFDMDGLMFDTERLCCSVWRQVGTEAGYAFSEQIFLDCVGRNEADSRKIVLDTLGDSFPYDELRQLVRVRMKDYIAEFGPPEKPGLRELLSFLEKKGVPMVLATSSQRRSAQSMLARANLEKFFSAGVYGDEVSFGKPHPEVFQKAISSAKIACGEEIKASDCVVFEDSPAGLQAANSAGIPTVFVKDLIEPPQEIMENVWLNCPSLDKAIPFLERFFPAG